MTVKNRTTIIKVKCLIDFDLGVFMINSMKSIARKMGISYSTVLKRKKNGASGADLYVKPMKYGEHVAKPCVDHLGNKFSSLTALCEHYKIDVPVFYSRMQKNWSLKDALTKPVHKVTTEEIIYNGVKYSTVNELFKKLNLNAPMGYYYLKKGRSLEDVIKMLIEKRDENC